MPLDEPAVARSVAEALQALAQAPDAAIMGGGTDIVRKVRRRTLGTSNVVDISRIEALRGVWETPDGLEIGALTTVEALATSPVVARHAPALAEAAASWANPWLRGRSTVGGHLADPGRASTLPPALLVLDAAIKVARGAQTTWVDLNEWLSQEDPPTEAELITAVRVPPLGARDRVGFRRVGPRLASESAAVVMAARLHLDMGFVTLARVAFGAVGAAPRRCPSVERALVGSPVRSKAVELIRLDVAAVSDSTATAAYRIRAAEGVLRAWLESVR